MWIPATAEELEDAARTGRFVEKSNLDAKREIGNGKEVSKDVNAMALEGGALAYGIAEDEHERPTIPAPFDLAGQKERIAEMVAASVQEPPYFEIHELRLADDPARGYLFVEIPASPVAPQQLKDGRYYGRTAAGNKVLTDAEIMRYMQRRAQESADSTDWIEELVLRAPFEPRTGSGYLHLGARPALPDVAMLDRAAGGDRFQLTNALVRAGGAVAGRGVPTIGGQQLHWLGADAIGVEDGRPDGSPRRYLRFELHRNGSAWLFTGAAADTLDSGFYLFDSVITSNVAQFCAILGTFYEAAGYSGPVDVGAAVTGIRGARSFLEGFELGTARSYQADRFDRWSRVRAAELSRQPLEVARTLIRPLFSVTHMNPDRPFDG